MEPRQFFVVDLRTPQDYAAGHIPNAVNVGIRGRFETWLGIMVPWGYNLVLCGSPEELKEAQFRLHRVGYKRSRVVTMDAWTGAGLPVAKNDPVTPRDLYALMQKGDPPVIVDVRLPNEWMGMRIGRNVTINSTAIADPSMIHLEDDVTIGGSASVLAHYAQGGYLVISPRPPRR